MALTDYLSAEGLIRARLQDELAETYPSLRVLSAADLDGVKEASQHTPALHVVYDGDDLGDRAGDGRAQLVRQRWMVWVVVRNARNQATSYAARTEGGTLLLSVLKALQGWQPSADHGELVRVSGAPRPLFSAGGFAYFPVAFHCAISAIRSTA